MDSAQRTNSHSQFAQPAVTHQGEYRRLTAALSSSESDLKRATRYRSGSSLCRKPGAAVAARTTLDHRRRSSVRPSRCRRSRSSLTAPAVHRRARWYARQRTPRHCCHPRPPTARRTCRKASPNRRRCRATDSTRSPDSRGRPASPAPFPAAWLTRRQCAPTLPRARPSRRRQTPYSGNGALPFRRGARSGASNSRPTPLANPQWLAPHDCRHRSCRNASDRLPHGQASTDAPRSRPGRTTPCPLALVRRQRFWRKLREGSYREGLATGSPRHSETCAKHSQSSVS